MLFFWTKAAYKTGPKAFSNTTLDHFNTLGIKTATDFQIGY